MYTVTNAIEKITWGATGVDSILQCVKMIITTPIGSVPLDRGFGLDFNLLNGQVLDAITIFSNHVKDVVEKLEPRVSVIDVNVLHNNKQGEPNIQVTLEIRGQ